MHLSLFDCSSRGRCFTSRVITSSDPHTARQSSLHPLLPLPLAHRQITLPPSHRLRCLESSWWPLELSLAYIAIKSSATLHLRPLHQTGAPTSHLRPIQFRPTPHIYRIAVSHGRADVRRIDSLELDFRMFSRVGLKRRTFATRCAWISWWVYTAGVGYARAIAEDEQMRNKFGEEWERYAMKVRYWYVPGLV